MSPMPSRDGAACLPDLSMNGPRFGGAVFVCLRVDNLAAWRHPWIAAHPGAATVTDRLELYEDLTVTKCAIRTLDYHFICESMLLDQNVFTSDTKLLQIHLDVSSPVFFQLIHIAFYRICASHDNRLNLNVGPFFRLNYSIRNCEPVCVSQRSCIEWQRYLRFFPDSTCASRSIKTSQNGKRYDHNTAPHFQLLAHLIFLPSNVAI